MTSKTVASGKHGRAVGAAALIVEDLACEIETPNGPIRPVDGVSFTLQPGRTLGVVGESGAGKSMLARSVMGIGPRQATVTGKAVLNSEDLLQLPKKKARKKLGSEISMIFQDSLGALNPVVPIGRQLTEGMRFHLGVSRTEARDRAIELLTEVGISDAADRLKYYPHQLSGGMCQRINIAIALSCNPTVLIADEATTALDVTVQKQILDLLQQVQEQHQMAMIIITHDLGVVAGRTDDIVVMYAGQIVERGPTMRLFEEHRHRYTGALLESIPKLEQAPHTELLTIPGIPPRLAKLPQGCRFAPRCAAATSKCEEADPEFVEDSPGHVYKCFWPRTSEAGPVASRSASSVGRES